MKIYGYPLLAIIQVFCCVIYSKVGNTDSYEWGVFFNVSNQLITAGYCFMSLYYVRNKQVRTAIIEAGIFSLFLSLLWFQWYIPPIHWLVETAGLSVPILSYFGICLSINFILYLQRNR